MKQASMTAQVSAFARAFHFTRCTISAFSDPIAKLLFTDEEFRQISEQMSSGISFFNPTFSGDSDEALRWIAENYLIPSPVGRSAFAEQALGIAVRIGATQYILLGAGYDTFLCRQPGWAKKLHIFELDCPATAEEKQRRLAQAKLPIPENVRFLPVDFSEPEWEVHLLQNTAFSRNSPSFCSLLGISYYFTSDTFEAILKALGELLPPGSSLVFDYPDALALGSQAGVRMQKQVLLAKAAGEPFLSAYSYTEMERLLERCGFLIYEHLLPREITTRFFGKINQNDPDHPIFAFDNVNYCLAVRK